MKRIIFIVSLMLVSLSATTVYAGMPETKCNSVNVAIADKKENKLSEVEMSRLTNRVEEIRNIDKSALTGKEKRELRHELKGIKENMRRDGGVVYISGGTVLLIIILILLLA